MLGICAYCYLRLKRVKSYVWRKIKEQELKKISAKKTCELLDVEGSKQRLINMRPYQNNDSRFEGKKHGKPTCTLSIIIPVYNAQDFIKQCMDSIINQNVKFSYEVICVNDGSTDDSLKVLGDYKEISNVVIVTQENLGAAEARNHGISLARGEYLMFVDSDDYVPNGALNKMIETALSSNADIVLGTIGKYIRKYGVEVYPKKSKDKIVTDYVYAADYEPGTPWGKLYRTELWNNVRFFNGYAYEDTVIFLNVYPKSKKFVLLGSPVYRFRSSDSSLFKRSNRSMAALDSLWIVFRCMDKAIADGIDVSDTRYLQLILWHLSSILYERVREIESEYVMEDAFVVAAEYLSNMYDLSAEHTFGGEDAIVFQRVYESFLKRDYSLWKQCCETMLNYKTKGEL